MSEDMNKRIDEHKSHLEWQEMDKRLIAYQFAVWGGLILGWIGFIMIIVINIYKV